VAKKAEKSQKNDPKMHVLTRFIGIRHRTKKTKEGEARPTEVAIIEPGKKPKMIKLEDEDSELNFVFGIFPTKWRKPKAGEEFDNVPETHLKRKKTGKVTKVACKFDGLKSGDTVAMMLGGSGDYLAYAMINRSRVLEHCRVLRVPGYRVKEYRGEDKENDSVHLAEMAINRPEEFYEIEPRDLEIVDLRMKFIARIEAMKARIATEQRLRQASIGQIFCNSSGINPERSVEQRYKDIKASDPILQAVMDEEKRRERELVKTLKNLDVFQELFAPITGVGPMIAGRIIIEVMDIRAYATPAKLKAKLGCHVLQGGKYTDVPKEHQFPRRRRGMTANWSDEGRKALFLLADQFNRRPNSEWGKKLLEYKAKFRAKHPEVVVVDGKKRYTNAHIHKMALWRTVTKFVERLHRDWTRLVEAGEIEESSDHIERQAS